MPSEAQRKVYVLRQADTMNPAAQNALLKLLEEPPRSASFILAAERAESLLPTVRSRCEVIRCNSEADALPAEAVQEAEAYLALLGDQPVSGLSAADANHSVRRVERCLEYLRSNVSARHIFGVLSLTQTNR